MTLLEKQIERVAHGLGGGTPIAAAPGALERPALRSGQPPTVTVEIPQASALRYFVSTDLNKLGEAFVNGDIQVNGPIHEVFRVAEKLAHRASTSTRASFVSGSFFARHNRKRDREAIQYHYDVSDEFYALFLGEGMTYSCAYYRDEDDTLEAAQEAQAGPHSGQTFCQAGVSASWMSAARLGRAADPGCRQNTAPGRQASRYRAINSTSHASGFVRRAWRIVARFVCSIIATFRKTSDSTRSQASACSSTSG